MQNKKIGIWGFGIVGKAALNYFSQQGISTTIMDTKKLNQQEKELIQLHKSSFLEQKNVETFLQGYDLILASPGIDLSPFVAYKHKFITELDIFYQEFKKPIIAITGTVGKTSITHLLTMLIGNHKTVGMGGNIGIGMLSLLQQKQAVDCALLEVSSFQLEYCTSFAPDLAIWTNLYQNHLDRHETLEAYFSAKCNLIAYQTKNQQALVPLNLAEKIKKQLPLFQQQIHFFSSQQPSEDRVKQFPQSHFFWLDEQNNIIQLKNGNFSHLISLSELPPITFPENWLIICASLKLLALPQPNNIILATLSLPAHRVERLATINGVDFYNDSKGTIIEATLAAVNKLQGRPILLFLGGISKGVDRLAALPALKESISQLFCFGSEAEQLHRQAQHLSIPSIACATLEEAFDRAVQSAKPGDQLLFSPSGASYDLFAHYEERGNCFKKLVEEYKKSLHFSL